MLTDILRVLAQLDDKRLLRPVLLGFVASAITLAGLVAVSAWLLGGIDTGGDGWFGRQLEALGLVEILGSFAVGVLALLLFPAVALTIQSLFLDSVCDAVEARYYANTPPAREVPIVEGVLAAVKLTVLVIVVNLVLLPVYLILMLLPPTGLILYFAVNGYLVGREYFETVGLRRLTLAEAKVTRRQNRMMIWMDGVLLVLLFTVPFVNLAGPTLGTAYMVHRFHRIW
ncbi:MAG: EI24 domain-containing protein [Alphaproteobacteria bacterium]|nr:EI24 domain-containing protein [Alphaproteobacteria bacterium]MCB9929249.1 EI24 domain-containing protein [Alphaproteobacteria bacterium]